MYLPTAFQETNRDRLFDFIERNSFGLLLSQVAGQPFVSHLPFLLARAAGPNGGLIGHLAAANPQVRQADGQTVLAVFSSPHVYVSPSWYEAENVVPTWNYVAVHVYGTLQVLEDRDAVARVLQDFVQRYESSLPRPWTFDAASEFAGKLMKQIVAFRVAIDRLEGKWKLNQNRPREQQARVAEVLRRLPDDNSREIARLMTENLERGP